MKIFFCFIVLYLYHHFLFSYLQLSQVGLTEKLKGDKRRFELWSRGREEVYIIQASTLQVKDTWVKEIKRVLLNQFDQIKSELYILNT